MDFFLEIHNGECGSGEHYCDHQRDHGPSVFISTQVEVRSQKLRTQNPEARIQDEEMNKESALS